MDGELRSLLDLYEARGDEDLYARAKPRYEQAIAADPDPVLIRDYGYLLECHARRELQRAVEQYEHALAIDPEADKVRYQKISAQAALGHINEEIRDYTAQVAAAPDDIRQYRCLARAYLIAQQYDKAGGAIHAGLALADHDRVLIECRGDLRAGTGDPEGALADWRHAVDLNPEDISPLYSTAFLYEREGRPETRSPPGPRSGTGPRPGATASTQNGPNENGNDSSASSTGTTRLRRRRRRSP